MKNSFFVLVGLLSALVSSGQIKINSPYSAYGIGDLQISEHAHLKGMASVGVSGGNMYFTNSVNPALLQRNLDSKLKYTISDFGFSGRFTTLKTEGATQFNGDVNLNNVSLMFPISNRSTLALGLKPYSKINYRISTTEFINSTDEITYGRTGNGGINKLYLADAYRLINDGKNQTYLSLGLEGNYMFGTIEEVTSSKLESSSTTSQFRQFTNFSDFAFKGGLAFRKGINAEYISYRGKYNALVDNFNGYQDTLSIEEFSCEQLTITKNDTTCIPIPENKKKKYKRHFLYLSQVEINDQDTIKTYSPIQKDLFGGAKRRMIASDSLLYRKKISFDTLAKPTGTYFNFGFVYEHNSSVGGNNLLISERLDANNGQIFADTLDDNRHTLTLPRILRLGISFDKPVPSGMSKYGLAKKSTWSIGLDVSLNQWSAYEHFDKNEPLKNTIRTAIGGEYSPNPLAGKWLGRWIYRGGVSYQKLPYEVEGKQFDEIGITFGTSIPMGTFSVRQRRHPKYINIAVEYGTRGAIGNGLVQENYFITTFSLTANSKWFTKRKIGL